jgi:glycosyltransferase involved in cell wall biosynthesis
MSRLVFVWDNFGPLHADRCDAVAAKFAGCREVIGLELAAKSTVYAWVPESGVTFTKITLFKGRAIEEVPFGERLLKTLRGCFSMGRDTKFFMCHYEHPVTLIVSSILRLFGRSVYAMGCSKFDDYPRSLRRENIKRIFYLPYCGGIASGVRSRDYMRFLGLNENSIKTEYNTVSLSRIQALSGAPPAPEGVPFSNRHFTVVARFVPKKNLSMALKAFTSYAAQVQNPRHIHLCGSGPLEAELRQQARDNGVEHLIHFRGFLQTADICRAYATSLVLLLPSIEEQFGNVVLEAQAMGLPVILSENCGARDRLVRTGVNGFVIEPDNQAGMAFFMKLLSEEEDLWTEMCLAAREFGRRGDAERFAEAAEALVGAGTPDGKMRCHPR